MAFPEFSLQTLKRWSDPSMPFFGLDLESPGRKFVADMARQLLDLRHQVIMLEAAVRALTLARDEAAERLSEVKGTRDSLYQQNCRLSAVLEATRKSLALTEESFLAGMKRYKDLEAAIEGLRHFRTLKQAPSQIWVSDAPDGGMLLTLDTDEYRLEPQQALGLLTQLHDWDPKFVRRQG